jgi:hypothetical protein
MKASHHSLSENHDIYWSRLSSLITILSSSSDYQVLSCDLMFRFLCLISLADDRDFARLQLLEFFRNGLQLGLLVKSGRAHDLLHFVPLLLDVDASLAVAAQELRPSYDRSVLLRIVAEACKLGGQYQRALHTLDMLDELASKSPGIANYVQSLKTPRSGDLGVSDKELKRVRLSVQLLMKKANGAEPPLPSFHDALVKADAAQVTIPAVEAGEFNAASGALALPPLLYHVGCRVRLQGLLQKQAVLNGAEGVVQSGVENKRVVVRLTRATSEAMEEWKQGFKVMTDRVQCMSLFEEE